MLIDTDKVKEIVTEHWSDKDLRPLLLFRGGFTEGRTRRCLNFVRTMMLAETPTVTEITKLSRVENDMAHLCGLHAKFGWERMGMAGFFSRVVYSPEITDRIAGLRDYIYWVTENTPQFSLWPPSRISEIASWKTKRPWRKGVKAPREQVSEFYPYITKPTSDHELLLAVDALVPKTFLNETRADVCQDMIVAILLGETTLENIKDAPARYVRKLMNASAEKYGHLSLDMPMYRGENAGAKTLGESIV